MSIYLLWSTFKNVATSPKKMEALRVSYSSNKGTRLFFNPDVLGLTTQSASTLCLCAFMHFME